MIFVNDPHMNRSSNRDRDRDRDPLPLPINSHDPQDYEILDTLHSSTTSTTYKARYLKSNTLVTIKVFKNYNKLEDVYGLTRATVLAKIFIDHPNIIGVHCSFKHQDQFWVVMPFANIESLNSTLTSCFPGGLSEACMVFILKETLKGLERVHVHGEVHDNVDLDHVFVNKEIREVKLDMGLLNFDNEGSSNRHCRPVWLTAPNLKRGNKVDIWMLGLLAVELFYGTIPASNPAEFKSLVSSIRDSKKCICANKSSNFIMKLVGRCLRSHVCSTNSAKIPSRLLGEVITLCLDQNPVNRPTASELLQHDLFRKSKVKKIC